MRLLYQKKIKELLMNDDKYEIRQHPNKKFYIYNTIDCCSESKDMEKKVEIHKVLAELRYPVIKTSYITKKRVHLFSV